MREIVTHKVGSVNEKLSVVAGEQEPSGSTCRYEIRFRSNFDEDLVCYFCFQKGAVGEAGVNGITNEVLMAVVIDRLQGFQSGPHACRENAIALTKLQEALHWLQHRTRERIARGVEGTLEN